MESSSVNTEKEAKFYAHFLQSSEADSPQVSKATEKTDRLDTNAGA